MLLTNAFNLNADFGSQEYVYNRCGKSLIVISPNSQGTVNDTPREIVRSFIAATAGAVTCYIVMGYGIVCAMDL